MSELDENQVLQNDENANHLNGFHSPPLLGSPSKVVKRPSLTLASTGETMDSLEYGNNEEEELKLSRRTEVMLKKEQQRKEDEENLTFQPKLFTASFYLKKQTEIGKTGDHNSPTKSISGFSDENDLDNGSPGKNLFDRLYSDALRRHYIHIHDEKELPAAPNHDLSIVLANSKDYTFQPKITSRGRKSEPHSAIKRAVSATSSASSSSAPSAEQQSKDISRQPSTDHNQGKANRKDQENISSFQPQISKKAKSFSLDKEVSQRLYENSLHTKEKLQRKKTEKEFKELELCTFQPLLNRSKKRSSFSSASASSSRASSRANSPVSISSSRRDHNNPDDFYSRLHHYEEKKNISLQAAKEQKEMNESCSFQPVLFTRSSSFHTNASTRDVPFYERLTDKQYQQQQRRRSISDIDKECTFHPKIKSKRTPSVCDFS
jgi:hypothetical protein